VETYYGDRFSFNGKTYQVRDKTNTNNKEVETKMKETRNIAITELYENEKT
jgi:hypothetical protein